MSKGQPATAYDLGIDEPPPDAPADAIELFLLIDAEDRKVQKERRAAYERWKKTHRDHPSRNKSPRHANSIEEARADKHCTYVAARGRSKQSGLTVAHAKGAPPMRRCK